MELEDIRAEFEEIDKNLDGYLTWRTLENYVYENRLDPSTVKVSCIAI